MASQHTRKVEVLRVVSRVIAILAVIAVLTVLFAPVALAQNPPVHFAKAVAYPSGGDWVYSVAVGNLNGDGHPDLVVANLCGNYNCYSGAPGIGQIGVLLGNGDGTFQPPVIYSSGGYDSYSVAIGDVNGDGHPDLVVANSCETSDCNNGSVSVLLGNGDGTFQSPLSYSSGGNAHSVAIGDVNGDGKPDIVVATCKSGTGFLLLW